MVKNPQQQVEMFGLFVKQEDLVMLCVQHPPGLSKTVSWNAITSCVCIKILYKTVHFFLLVTIEAVIEYVLTTHVSNFFSRKMGVS